jgi:hypothetical protein
MFIPSNEGEDIIPDYDKINEWPLDDLMGGVWTIFPNVSIASFMGGGRAVLLSQLMPGDNPDESYTTQYYLMENKPNKQQEEEANKQFDFLEYVVRDEDYTTGIRLQKGLKTGMIDNVMFGKNEGAGQTFHGWVDKIINTSDEDLPNLYKK